MLLPTTLYYTSIVGRTVLVRWVRNGLLSDLFVGGSLIRTSLRGTQQIDQRANHYEQADVTLSMKD